MNRYHPSVLVALIALSTFLGAQSAPPLTLADRTVSSGITWTQTDSGFMMGAGGAILDYDGDGFEDLVFVGGISSVGLFRNLGDGTFADVSATSGLVLSPGTLDVMGIAAADYDNDGDTDIYVLANGANALFRNDGGFFNDVTMVAGLIEPRWTTAGAFADYDGDGDLDLYVGNYIHTLNFPYHVPDANALYRNNGDGTFTDVTADSGVAGAGTTLAVTWSDIDGDGDQDLWVANDFGRFVQPNRLYRNDGVAAGNGWAFTEISDSVGAAQALYCMGLTLADVDKDLDFDCYMSNLGANAFLRNDGVNGFTDVTSMTGTFLSNDPSNPALLATSWSVGFHDFDNDTWPDLYVSNGHIPSAAFIANGTQTPNAVFRNLGGMNFQDVSAVAGVQNTSIGRGAAFGDLDRDGDVDVVQFNVNASPVLFWNETAPIGNWLSLQFRGRRTNRDAFGTRVFAELSGETLVRDVHANYGFESTSSKRVHFGLGAHTEIPRLRVRWPSGGECFLHHVPANIEWRVVEPLVTVDRGASVAPTVIASGSTLNLDMVLRNDTTVARSVATIKAFSINGGPLNYAPNFENVAIPAASSVTRGWSVPLPQGLVPSGQTLDVQVVWSAVDAAGAIDQWEARFTVTP